MKFTYFKPSGILAQYIKYYWVLETEQSEGNVSERVVPTGNIELLFHYRNPFIMKHSDNSQTTQSSSMLGGISDSFSDVLTQGEAGVIAVTFLPHGACNFFRFPLNEIEKPGIGLENIYYKEIKEVSEKISNAVSLHLKIKIIEEFLLSKLKPLKEHDVSYMRHSIFLINSKSGQITASELSNSLAISPRNLERKFSAFIGKSPKQFIRIVRFQEVIRKLSLGDRSYLTDYAYNNGYFDQSHFIKDFKSLSGYTPKEFVKLGACQSDYFQ